MYNCTSNKGCGCEIPLGKQGPQGPQGERGISGFNGVNGVDGISVQSEYVSDGTTAIGGTVYPLNTLIMLLSNGTYINAGIISPVNDLVWEDLTLLNSWGVAPGFGTPQYAIDNNFIYFRGVISPGLTDNAFSVPITMSVNALSHIQDTEIASSSPSIFILDTIGSARILDFAGQDNFMLDTIGPISITR